MAVYLNACDICGEDFENHTSSRNCRTKHGQPGEYEHTHFKAKETTENSLEFQAETARFQALGIKHASTGTIIYKGVFCSGIFLRAYKEAFDLTVLRMIEEGAPKFRYFIYKYKEADASFRNQHFYFSEKDNTEEQKMKFTRRDLDFVELYEAHTQMEACSECERLG